MKWRKAISLSSFATLGMMFLATHAVAQQQDCQPKIGWITLPSSKAKGDAVAADVLEGKTFSNSNALDIPGEMTNNGAMSFTPGTASQNIPKGYHNGSGSVAGDPNLLPGNIKNGATIFGVTGSSVESSGTATPDQVLSGQTFSNASGPATGTMPNIGQQNITPSTTDQGISQGYHDGTGAVAGDADLASGNIRSGVNIFGVAGDANVVNTGSGDAAPGDMLSGKKAWVDGSEVTGTMPTQTLSASSTTVAAGYYAATDLSTVDTDLAAANIKCGVNMYGITGTHTNAPDTICSPSTGRVWMDRNLGATRVATSETDSAAYGDLYQWGRLSDGHEKRTSSTTTTLSASDVPGHGNFITNGTTPSDWSNPQNGNRWQGVSGINNPCPSGFRIPTTSEWSDEFNALQINNSTAAFNSILKLTGHEARDNASGMVWTSADNYFWSATHDSSYSQYIYIYPAGLGIGWSYRAQGFSVRCIMD